MSFHNQHHVQKTRRTRRCDWCDDLIQKGDPSVATSGVNAGDFYQGRYHPECSEAITRYYNTFDCWGDEMPDELMNRGGIEPKGEPEQALPTCNVTTHTHYP